MTVRRSLGIVALTRICVFAIGFLAVIAVSRLLSPKEIGVFSVSVAIVSLGHVFRDFGVGQYLIHLKEVTRGKKRAAFTVTLVFSWSIALLLLLLHPAAAEFYANDGVGQMLQLLSINFLTLPFGAPLRSLLQREMQFAKLALVDISYTLVQSGTTVMLAWAGASYMSLAWGSIAGNLANVFILLVISPKGALDWPTHRGLGDVLRFGSKATAASLATAAGDASPDLILGRTLGFADVAFYSRGRSLVAMALEQVMYVVRTVYAPAFARDFHDGKDPAQAYAKTVGLLLGITVPVTALAAVLAPFLIVWLFGDQWERSAPLASAFCLFALITAPFALASTSLVATGHVGLMMRARLVIEGCRISIMLLSVVLALEQVVAALGIVYFIEAVLLMRALRTTIHLSYGQLWGKAWRSYALIAPVLGGPSLLLLWAHSHPLSNLTVLLVGALLGVAGWLIGLMLLNHPIREELQGLTRALNAGLKRLASQRRQ